MRNVEYITNGFGGLYDDLLKFGIGPGPNPLLTPEMQYRLNSPSGGSMAVSSRVYSDLQQRFGRVIAEEAVPLGLNPKFLDIARGPSGRTYLTQAIRFVQAYKQAASDRTNVTFNVAYDAAEMSVGTSSPLTPSRRLIKNLISKFGIDGVDGLMRFYNTVLSAL